MVPLPGKFRLVFSHLVTCVLRHIRAALKRGGRLAIVEPKYDSSRGLERDKQVAQHDIAIEIVEEERRAAGFWLLVARRPCRAPRFAPPCNRREKSTVERDLVLRGIPLTECVGPFSSRLWPC